MYFLYIAFLFEECKFKTEGKSGKVRDREAASLFLSLSLSLSLFQRRGAFFIAMQLHMYER
jgi:hypothetical protein